MLVNRSFSLSNQTITNYECKDSKFSLMFSNLFMLSFEMDQDHLTSIVRFLRIFICNVRKKDNLQLIYETPLIRFVCCLVEIACFCLNNWKFRRGFFISSIFDKCINKSRFTIPWQEWIDLLLYFFISIVSTSCFIVKQNDLQRILIYDWGHKNIVCLEDK